MTNFLSYWRQLKLLSKNLIKDIKSDLTNYYICSYNSIINKINFNTKIDPFKPYHKTVREIIKQWKGFKSLYVNKEQYCNGQFTVAYNFYLHSLEDYQKEVTIVIDDYFKAISVETYLTTKHKYDAYSNEIYKHKLYKITSKSSCLKNKKDIKLWLYGALSEIVKKVEEHKHS